MAEKNTPAVHLPIVVIGASAGGLAAVKKLLPQFDGLDVAVFVVLHLSNGSGNYLLSPLQKTTSFLCKMAEDNDRILTKTVYIARANSHLVIKEGEMVLGHGPPENRWRPSIDVTFRSAAVAYGPYVTGIILSGYLDDGTAGMIAIKKCGGKCIVQSPGETDFPDMPRSVLANIKVDYTLPVEEMGAAVKEILKLKKSSFSVPPEVRIEAEIAEKAAIGMEHIQQLGAQSEFSCPDCGGIMRDIEEGEHHRYRCYTGHVYSQDSLMTKQAKATEDALWVAIRTIEERRNMMLKMAWQHNKKTKMTAQYLAKADEMAIHIEKVKEILFGAQSLN